MKKRPPRKVVLQKSPRITVCFPSTYTEKQEDIWLAKWYSSRNLTH